MSFETGGVYSYTSHYSDTLQGGQSEDEIVEDGSDFSFSKPSQSGPGAHTVLCNMGTGALPPG